ncbi:hypothetical protein ON010_g3503 [Phytophthora cinnamomi]|nr:hypothetical protein ON010_g3503 [Phytophthora cinnamomi]
MTKHERCVGGVRSARHLRRGLAGVLQCAAVRIPCPCRVNHCSIRSIVRRILLRCKAAHDFARTGPFHRSQAAAQACLAVRCLRRPRIQATFPESTLAYELTTSMMRYMFVEFGETIVNDYTHLMREPFAMHGRLILQSNCRKHNTAPEMLLANGMEHTWLRDPETKEHRIVVIHYHGGGYCISDPLQDVELANQTHSILKQILKEQYQLEVSVDVLLVNYRKAPEYLYPTALNDCFDMYKYVLKHESVAPAHVVFSGDSAGAEMSMTNCMRLRKESPELQPAAALCYSPMVDFSEVDSDDKSPYCILVTNFADRCIATYLRSVTDPEKRQLASAINQSLRDLPPIFLQWGKLEGFHEQGLRFKVKADAEGVTNMELDILKNMVHDPVMLPTAVSPAAEKGIRNGCAFAAKHLANALRLRSVDPEPEPHNINNMW